MTHVTIRTTGPNEPDYIDVEGFDLSLHVAAVPMRIEYPAVGPPLVHVALMADTLDAAHRPEPPELTEKLRRQFEAQPRERTLTDALDEFSQGLREDRMKRDLGKQIGDLINTAVATAARRARS